MYYKYLALKTYSSIFFSILQFPDPWVDRHQRLLYLQRVPPLCTTYGCTTAMNQSLEKKGQCYAHRLQGWQDH